MLDWLRISKDSDTPVYRQISRQIIEAVSSGRLKAGDKILPERELAAGLGVARGTIKKAYQELEQNQIIESTQGRGSFISSRQNLMEKGRKEQAVQLINDMIISLENMNFTHREMGNFFQLLLMEREARINEFQIAAVDCNPEALDIIREQLSYISRVRIHTILLDEITGRSEAAGEKLGSYDLIITTTTHYNELLGLAPGLQDRMLQVALAPSQKTIIDLASLTPGTRLGIISYSKTFARIIKNRLKSFGMGLSAVKEALYRTEKDLSAFLEDRKVLILPPGIKMEESGTPKASLQNFRESGGRIIRFEYQIERGSLVYMEEEIYKRLNS